MKGEYRTLRENVTCSIIAAQISVQFLQPQLQVWVFTIHVMQSQIVSRVQIQNLKFTALDLFFLGLPRLSSAKASLNSVLWLPMSERKQVKTAPCYDHSLPLCQLQKLGTCNVSLLPNLNVLAKSACFDLFCKAFMQLFSVICPEFMVAIHGG